jgi:hypothetical protein
MRFANAVTVLSNKAEADAESGAEADAEADAEAGG